MSEKKQYAVVHKTSGLFFGGFGANGQPLWVAEHDARVYYQKAAAMGQALLFRCMDVAAQVKPQELSVARRSS